MKRLEAAFKPESKYRAIVTLFILSAILGLCNSAYAATIKTGKKLS